MLEAVQMWFLAFFLLCGASIIMNFFFLNPLPSSAPLHKACLLFDELSQDVPPRLQRNPKIKTEVKHGLFEDRLFTPIFFSSIAMML
jgi:hypothetical protein